MARKAQALGLVFFLIGVAVAASGQEKSPNRIVAEKLIGKIPASSIPESLQGSADSKRITYVAQRLRWFGGNKFSVVADGKEGKQYDFVRGIRFSPDSRHLV